LDNEPGLSNDVEPVGMPDDFPRALHQGAVAGAQPKLLLSRWGRKFYSPGCTPPELYERWRRCETIAAHLCVKSIESKSGKRSHMTELEILEQYLVRLLATGWVSAPEASWTMRRCAELLGDWPVPHGAQERPEGGT
jgi:hypothetical protein